MTPFERLGRSRQGRDRWDNEPGEAVLVEALRSFAESVPADEGTLTRGRAALRTAFAASAAQPRPAAPRPPFARRRIALAGAALALLLVAGVGGVLAESGPGEPFYRLRLDLEALTLPQPGTPDRTVADLDRAEARLGEATRAASVGNWAAETDALNAYADVVTGLSNDPGVGAGAAQDRLTSQLESLERLRGKGTLAREALERAIDAVRARLGMPNHSPEVSPQPSSGDGKGAGEPSGLKPSAGPNESAGPNQSSGNGGQGGPGPGSGSTAAPGPNGPGPNGPGPTASSGANGPGGDGAQGGSGAGQGSRSPAGPAGNGGSPGAPGGGGD